MCPLSDSEPTIDSAEEAGAHDTTVESANSTLASSSGGELLLAEGSIFASRYRIDGVLGRGGMGEVYRAYDTIFERAVALKIVRVNNPGVGTDEREEAKRRFLNEARVVRALEHPHIVAIYDAGESDGLPYLVLELCDGGNLRKAMVGADQATRLRWLTEVAKGLAYAHDRGIVHRDAKPENVVITKDGIAKVTDFGIAKAVRPDREREDVTYSVAGTPRYMAPEQIVGQRVDGRADQFAWAVMGYELLGDGAAARPGDDERADAGATVASSVPTQVRRVLARAIASQPNDRYKNFHALLGELRPSRKRRAWVILLACGVVAITVGALRGLFASHPDNTRAEHPITATVAAFDEAKIDAEAVARCSPAARPALAAGLQLWRDASQWQARDKFDEAAKNDPGCAVANAYYVLVTLLRGYRGLREHYRHAWELRARLSDRERQFLDALEPSLQEVPNFEEVLRRTLALVQQAPTDLDFRWIQVHALRRLERLDEAIAIADQVAALRREPIPNNELEAAMVQIRKRNDDAAYDRFARCLRAAPDSDGCIAWQGLLRGSKGECAASEALFRRASQVMPDSEIPHLLLAEILLTSSKDPEAARGEFEEHWRRPLQVSHNSPTLAAARLIDEYKMAIVGGDLEKALRFVREWNKEVGSGNNGRYRGEALVELIELLWELGSHDEARTLALKALRERRAWISDDILDLDIELPRLAYVTSGIGAEEYRRFRDEWIGRERRLPARTWIAGFAGLPEVGANMEPPMAAGEYALDWIDMEEEDYARASAELVRIGRTADAVQHADAAASSCFVNFGMGYLHAQLASAKAHDAAHDVAGACERYVSLRDRLRKSPRSTTLHFAERRIKELSCKDDGRRETATGMSINRLPPK